MRSLEEVAIIAMEDLGVRSPGRVEGLTGAWANVDGGREGNGDRGEDGDGDGDGEKREAEAEAEDGATGAGVIARAGAEALVKREHKVGLLCDR